MNVQPVVRGLGATFQQAAALGQAEIGSLMIVWSRRDLAGVLSEGDLIRMTLPGFDDVLAAAGTQAYWILVGTLTLKQVEIAYRFVPLVEAVLRAQEVAEKCRWSEVGVDLEGMLSVLCYLSGFRVQKVSVNPFSPPTWSR